MPKLLDAPFWLDLSDPHRIRSAIQPLTRSRSYNYAAASGDWRQVEGRWRMSHKDDPAASCRALQNFAVAPGREAELERMHGAVSVATQLFRDTG